MPAAPRRLPPAVADIITAAEWYDDQQPGLGDDFLTEVDAVIRSLPLNPCAHAVRLADVRCARLKRFKRYGVYYFVWQEEVIVLLSIKDLSARTNFCREGTQRTQREAFLSLRSLRSFAAIIFGCGVSRAGFSVFHGNRHPRWLRERRRQFG